MSMSLVIHESRHARHLRAGRCRRIRSEFGGKMLLQPFDALDAKAEYAPQHVTPIWRGMKHVRWRRQVTTIRDSRHQLGAVAIDIEKDVTDGGDRCSPARALPWPKRIHAHVHVRLQVAPSKPRLESRAGEDRHGTDALCRVIRVSRLQQHG